MPQPLPLSARRPTAGQVQTVVGTAAMPKKPPPSYAAPPASARRAAGARPNSPASRLQYGPHAMWHPVLERPAALEQPAALQRPHHRAAPPYRPKEARVNTFGGGAGISPRVAMRPRNAPHLPPNPPPHRLAHAAYANAPPGMAPPAMVPLTMAMSAMVPSGEGEADDQPTQPRHANMGAGTAPEHWIEWIRPAIVWLYGFVDTEMTMVEGAAAAAILEEHKSALHDLARQVNGVLRASGDNGLAACLWRALVALMVHFTDRTEPLLGKLRQHELDVAAHHTLVARHEAEKAELERQLSVLRAGDRVGRRGSLAGRRSSVRRSSTRPRAASLASPPGIDENAVYMDAEDEASEEEGEEEEVDPLMDEVAQLHDRLVAATSELVQERNRTASLKREVQAQREKLLSNAALSRIQALPPFLAPAHADEDDDASEDSALPDAPTAEAGHIAKRAASAANARKVSQLQEEVRALRARCEAEQARRYDLEHLRDEFVRRFSLAFVTQVERSMPPPEAAMPAALPEGGRRVSRPVRPPDGALRRGSQL